jgi:hypothetical protein
MCNKPISPFQNPNEAKKNSLKKAGSVGKRKSLNSPSEAEIIEKEMKKQQKVLQKETQKVINEALKKESLNCLLNLEYKDM